MGFGKTRLSAVIVALSAIDSVLNHTAVCIEHRRWKTRVAIGALAREIRQHQLIRCGRSLLAVGIDVTPLWFASHAHTSVIQHTTDYVQWQCGINNMKSI